MVAVPLFSGGVAAQTDGGETFDPSQITIDKQAAKNLCDYTEERATLGPAFLYPVSMCDNIVVNENIDPAKVDSVEKLTLLQSAESNAQSSDSMFTIYRNYQKDMQSASAIEFRSQIYDSWEAGATESEAVTQSKNAVDKYYNIKKVNMLNQLNKTLLDAGASNQQVDQFDPSTGTNPFIYFDAENTTDAVTNMIAYPTGNTVEQEITFTDNNTQTTKTLTVAEVSVYSFASSSEVYRGAIVTDTTELTDSTVSGIDVTNSAGDTIKLTPSLTVTGFTTSEGKDYPSRNVYNFSEYESLFSDISSDASTVRSNITTTLVSDTFTAINNGDVTRTDLLGVDGLVKQLSGDSTISSDRFKVSMYRILDIGSPDFSQTSSISGEYTGATDYRPYYFPETSQRALQGDNYKFNEPVKGMLFTQNFGANRGDTVVFDPVISMSSNTNNNPYKNNNYMKTYANYQLEKTYDSTNSEININVYKTYDKDDVNNQDRNPLQTITTGSSSLDSSIALFSPSGEIFIFAEDSTDTEFIKYEINSEGTEFTETERSTLNASINYQNTGRYDIYNDFSAIPISYNHVFYDSDNSVVNHGLQTDRVVINGDYILSYNSSVSALEWYKINSDGSTTSELQETNLSSNSSTLLSYEKKSDGVYTSVWVDDQSEQIEKREIDFNNDTSTIIKSKSVNNISNYSIELGGKYIIGDSTDNIRIFDKNLNLERTITETQKPDHSHYDVYLTNLDSVDRIIFDRGEFVNQSSDEYVFNRGVLKITDLQNSAGEPIETVTSSTITDIENKTGKTIDTIVSEMSRFDSVDDVDGTDDIAAIEDQYGVTIDETTLNTQNWSGGADYQTTNITDYTTLIQSLQDDINDIKDTYSDGSTSGGGIGGFDSNVFMLLIGGALLFLLIGRAS